jgi:hypothetical protein
MFKTAILALVMSIVLMFASLRICISGIDSSTHGAPFPFLEHYSGGQYIRSFTPLLWSCVCIYLFSFATLILAKVARRSGGQWILRGLFIGAWLWISTLMIYRVEKSEISRTSLVTRGVPFYWFRSECYSGVPYHPEYTYSIGYSRALKSILFWSAAGIVLVRCLVWCDKHRTRVGSPPGMSGMESGTTAQH